MMEPTTQVVLSMDFAQPLKGAPSAAAELTKDFEIDLLAGDGLRLELFAFDRQKGRSGGRSAFALPREHRRRQGLP